MIRTSAQSASQTQLPAPRDRHRRRRRGEAPVDRKTRGAQRFRRPRRRPRRGSAGRDHGGRLQLPECIRRRRRPGTDRRRRLGRDHPCAVLLPERLRRSPRWRAELAIPAGPRRQRGPRRSRVTWRRSGSLPVGRSRVRGSPTPPSSSRSARPDWSNQWASAGQRRPPRRSGERRLRHRADAARIRRTVRVGSQPGFGG